MTPANDVSQFFEEEVAPSDAKARRLARKKEEAPAITPPKSSVLEAREKRLARLKEKEAKAVVETKSQKAPKKGGKSWKGKDTRAPKKDAPSPIGASPTHVPETGIATSWKKSWEVCLEDDKWVCYADGKKVLHLPCKGAGKI